MSLERIAELHAERVSTFDGHRYCSECSHDWPCPTRRLCDEAAENGSDWRPLSVSWAAQHVYYCEEESCRYCAVIAVRAKEGL